MEKVMYPSLDPLSAPAVMAPVGKPPEGACFTFNVRAQCAGEAGKFRRHNAIAAAGPAAIQFLKPSMSGFLPEWIMVPKSESREREKPVWPVALPVTYSLLQT